MAISFLGSVLFELKDKLLPCEKCKAKVSGDWSIK